MRCRRPIFLRACALLASGALSALALDACQLAPRARPRPSPVLVRAQEFLTRELAQWHAEERCASCHHDGDAARVLWSIDAGFDALREARLAAHRDRLLRSPLWCDPQADPRFREEGLALVQRAAALHAALARGARLDAAAVVGLLEALRAQQEEPGNWLGSTATGLGGPVTYGPFLATAVALGVLEERAEAANVAAVRRGRAWLASARASATLEHAAVAWALAAPRELREREARDRSVAALLARATRRGGFAPWEQGPAEVFDTALALIALQAQPAAPALARACAAARGFLEREQEPDGGWRETTRPADGESRAHRVSTSAWAAQASRDRSRRAAA
ncbi:MAG: hypothetical protein IPN34_24985 [Planctomycetes bacterium]|nr:hypothetical protein [Planctomycetota bacterium]